MSLRFCWQPESLNSYKYQFVTFFGHPHVENKRHELFVRIKMLEMSWKALLFSAPSPSSLFIPKIAWFFRLAYVIPAVWQYPAKLQELASMFFELASLYNFFQDFPFNISLQAKIISTKTKFLMRKRDHFSLKISS